MSLKPFIAGIPILAASLVAYAAGPVVYPAKGQSAEQTARDKIDCGKWATGESGFDPARAPPPPPQAAPKQRGGTLRGALAGVAVGEIVNDKGGEGAAAGALIGGMRQASRNQQAQGQADAQYQQAMQGYQAAQAAYARAS